jgi:hypothetical protein
MKNMLPKIPKSAKKTTAETSIGSFAERDTSGTNVTVGRVVGIAVAYAVTLLMIVAVIPMVVHFG